MLVLNVPQKHSFIIQTSEGVIEITHLPSEPNKTRIGIHAPKSMKIIRGDLLTSEQLKELHWEKIKSTSGSSSSDPSAATSKPEHRGLPLRKRADGSFGLAR